ALTGIAMLVAFPPPRFGGPDDGFLNRVGTVTLWWSVAAATVMIGAAITYLCVARWRSAPAPVWWVMGTVVVLVGATAGYARLAPAGGDSPIYSATPLPSGVSYAVDAAQFAFVAALGAAI